MPTVASADGTPIAYERSGSGPALVLVDGALCYRANGPARPLAKALEGDFTVYTYDRRGRGESGDSRPYAVEREVEDLAAVIAAAGGEAFAFGQSSGAALALEAADRGLRIPRLAVFEAPFLVDDGHPARPADIAEQFDALVAAGRRSEAVSRFLRLVGLPAPFLLVMRLLPVWRKLTAVAHTLPNDFRVLGDTGSGRPLPAGRWAGATMPVLSLVGGKSPAYLHASMRAVADVLPAAEFRVLPGQTHMLKPAAVAPVLREFLLQASPAGR